MVFFRVYIYYLTQGSFRNIVLSYDNITFILQSQYVLEKTKKKN